MESPKLDTMKEEFRQKQISTIKKAVLLTLEKLEGLEAQKNILQNQIKILKHDLFDLKDGRLDRILERQNLNEEVKTISCLIITKEENAPNTPPWYENYLIWIEKETCRINNSSTKTHAAGSYKLKNGLIKYL